MKKAQQNTDLPAVAIFDLDGTVFDTEYAVSEITADLAKSAGLSAMADYVFQNVSGLGSKEKFQALAKVEGRVLDTETLDRLSAEHRRLKEGLYDAPDFHLVDGVKDLIESLSNHGVTIVAATNNHHDGAVKGLQRTKLLDYFEDRIYAPAVSAGAKNPTRPCFYRFWTILKSIPLRRLAWKTAWPGSKGSRGRGSRPMPMLTPGPVRQSPPGGRHLMLLAIAPRLKPCGTSILW